jgi:hypothetical protein
MLVYILIIYVYTVVDQANLPLLPHVTAHVNPEIGGGLALVLAMSQWLAHRTCKAAAAAEQYPGANGASTAHLPNGAPL